MSIISRNDYHFGNDDHFVDHFKAVDPRESRGYPHSLRVHRMEMMIILLIISSIILLIILSIIMLIISNVDHFRSFWNDDHFVDHLHGENDDHFVDHFVDHFTGWKWWSFCWSFCWSFYSVEMMIILLIILRGGNDDHFVDHSVDHFTWWKWL